MTLNLYVDGYTVTKGLSECSFTLKGPQAGVLTGGTEKQGSCSCTPALLFTGSRWCWSEALQAPCPALSRVLGPRATSAHTWYVHNTFCTLSQNREEVLSPFAHAVFCSVFFGVLEVLKSLLFLL